MEEGAGLMEEGAGGKMIWDDWDATGKEFWNSTIQTWSGDFDHEWDIDSYESMSYWSGKTGPWQSYASARANKLYNDELDRWYDDVAKNTGADYRETKYPILQNRKRFGDSVTPLAVSQAVIDFYSPFVKYRW